MEEGTGTSVGIKLNSVWGYASLETQTRLLVPYRVSFFFFFFGDDFFFFLVKKSFFVEFLN